MAWLQTEGSQHPSQGCLLLLAIHLPWAQTLTLGPHSFPHRQTFFSASSSSPPQEASIPFIQISQELQSGDQGRGLFPGS